MPFKKNLVVHVLKLDTKFYITFNIESLTNINDMRYIIINLLPIINKKNNICIRILDIQ